MNKVLLTSCILIELAKASIFDPLNSRELKHSKQS